MSLFFNNSPPRHLVILVHGWMGNHKEMNYLKSALEAYPNIDVHSALCNELKTNDGIEKGGERLAREVQAILDQSDRIDGAYKSISFVGNSLGGLYARYAIKDIQHSCFGVFCTTATPHLGVSEHTYLPLPYFVESLVARVMGATGLDLFRRTTVVNRLNQDPTFLEPLGKFKHRFAIANTFYSDFQVPTATAAFLGNHSTVHKVLPVQHPWEVLRVQTDSSGSHDLDSLGWIKIFCDVREHLITLPNPFGSSPSFERESYTSAELIEAFSAKYPDRISAPFGHTVLVANAKNDFYARLNAAGRPIMDSLAAMIAQSLQSI